MASHDNDSMRPSHRPWQAISLGPFWGVLLVGVLISLLVWRIAVRFEDEIVQARFQTHAAEQSQHIREQFDATTAALQDLASVYAISDVVTGEQFARFAAPVIERQPALQALSWNPVIKLTERAAHESAMRQDGKPGYRITERSAQGGVVAAAPRQQYVVVAAIEPLAGNEDASGFDVNSEATRRLALERARDSGVFSIAAPITLVQNLQLRQGALGFLPRYKPDLPVTTVEQRRAAVEGYFVAIVDISEAIAAAFAKEGLADMDIQVFTSAPGQVAAEWYSSTWATGSDPIDATPVQFSDRDKRPAYVLDLPWGGNIVGLRFVASPRCGRDLELRHVDEELNFAFASVRQEESTELAPSRFRGVARLHLTGLVRNPSAFVNSLRYWCHDEHGQEQRQPN